MSTVRTKASLPHNGKNVDKEGMATARAGTREEALRLLKTGGSVVVALDYETGWQDESSSRAWASKVV